ncbi:NADPH-dependent FMN reductase [Micromonospora sp. NBC_01796]|uniref:NADPH-dependent FMN reductase n=1 Tax=Micromonospora sp. NBC_01796 TaxID=2975987 RepID=UPI002DDC3C7E|nr:NADPH-dependent FMN reductase [Micromonospora sp. NBC_01796]WSA84987.1 NADPH-dependent FMN reductase [Micromonospora sp. NBC_01796]
MPTILAISGSPSATSRTERLVELLAGRLAGGGHQVRALSIRDVPPDALLGADPAHPAIVAVADALAAADGLLVATPVYKASYSGALKALLDLLPQYALAGKVVLPLATGGTLAHVLAIDYAMRPVLNAMGAAHIVPGYFLLDQLILTGADGATVVEATAAPALHAVVDTFAAALAPRALPIAA